MKCKEHGYDIRKQYPMNTILKPIESKGEKHIPEGESEPIASKPFRDADGNESVLIQLCGRFRLDNFEEGYGSYETLRRL